MNNSFAFSSSTGEHVGSGSALGYTVALLAGFTIAGIALSNSKAGGEALTFIYHTVNHLLGGAPRTVGLPGPIGFPLVGNLYQMKDGHIQMIKEWTKQHGPVIRVALGEREAIFINSHSAIAQTVVGQGPAYQSRPIFKLFHKDFAASGIWTVGTSPYGEGLARTRKSFSAQIAPRVLPIYIPLIQPQLKRLIGMVSNISKGPALDLAEILHCYGSGMVSDQLFGTALPDSLISHVAYNETNIFRQRTVGSPARDYIAILRVWDRMVYGISSIFGLRYGASEKEEMAKEYRRLQQIYINDLLKGLRERIENGDETPSIMGGMMRSGVLSDEEVLLASYTGIAAGINLGYALTWTVGYLANHPEMQEKAYNAIQEVYHGAAPDPYEFDRVEYVKAIHMEGSRYYAPVRLGFPRETFAESTFNGIKIPAGILTLINCFACNRDPAAFDDPENFIPERWMNGHHGRTDTADHGAEKLGVPHLTYGAGRRVCPGIDMANRGLYSTLVLFIHFFKWERGPLAEEEKKHVFPPFRAARECTAEMDPILDTSTPTEAQAIPWACGLKFTPRDPDALAEWIAREV